MRKISIVSAVLGFIVGTAGAANITIYHSPSCPHCHHARDFFKDSLIYEYSNLSVTEVNVMDAKNRVMFSDALQKCGFSRGGVPVIVVGEKCFQGYATEMQDELRAAVEEDMDESAKGAAKANRQALGENADAFKQSHADRLNAITEYSADSDNQKKNKLGHIGWYVLVVALAAGLGFILLKRKGK